MCGNDFSPVPDVSLDWERFGNDGDGTRNLAPTVPWALQGCLSLVLHYIVWTSAAQGGGGIRGLKQATRAR